MKKYYYYFIVTIILIISIILFVLILPPVNIKNKYYKIFSQKIQTLTYSALRNNVPTKKKFEKINEIQLIISKKNLNHLDTLYSRYENEKYGIYSDNPSKGYGLDYYSKNNKRFPAKLIYKTDTFNVKIKSHGNQPDLHRHNSFISLNIKSNNKIKPFNEKRIKLIIYERVNYRKKYDEIITLSKEFNLEFLPSKLINVDIKGIGEHLFYLEYRLNENNLNKLFPNKNFLFIEGIGGNIILNNSDKQNKFLKKLKKSKDSLIYQKITSLNNDINSNNIEKIIDYFDFNYITNFETFRTIGGLTGHGLEGDNLEIFFNIYDNKFYPIVHRDCFFGNIDTCDVELSCLDKYRWDGGGNYGNNLTLFKLIRSNPLIKKEVRKKMKNFLKTKEKTIDKLKIIKNKHEIRYYPFYVNNMKNLKYSYDPVIDNIYFLDSILN